MVKESRLISVTFDLRIAHFTSDPTGSMEKVTLGAPCQPDWLCLLPFGAGVGFTWEKLTFPSEH